MSETRKWSKHRTIVMTFRVSVDERFAIALAAHEVIPSNSTAFDSVFVRNMVLKDRTVKRHLKQLKRMEK